MSSSGLAFSRTKSAIFPFSTVPRESSRPKNSAGLRVAAFNASNGVNPRGDKGLNLPTLIFRQNGDELSESFFTKCIQHELLVLARPVSSGYLKQFLTPRRGRLQDLIEMLHGSLPS